MMAMAKMMRIRNDRYPRCGTTCGTTCVTSGATASRIALGAAMALAFGMAACKNPQVGRECILPGLGDAGVTQTVVGSPALECPARTCIHVAGGAADLCTAECG